MPSFPTFEEWQEYCFTLGRDDFSGSTEDPAAEARYDHFVNLPPTLIADYLTRLLENAGRLEVAYTPDQLATGTWFIFGVGSLCFGVAEDPSVPAEAQVRLYRAMTRIYLDLYDRLCARRGTTDADLSETDELDGAVYMIWDMGCVGGAVMFPEKSPFLVEPGFEVLQTVLHHCQTGACLKSALHGLGHLHSYHPHRVESMIDNFLTDRKDHLPGWLVEYAQSARDGMVQ